MQGLTLIPMPPRGGYPCSLSQCGTDQAGECPTNRLLPLLGRTTKFALRGQGEVAALAFCVSGCFGPSSAQSEAREGAF